MAKEIPQPHDDFRDTFRSSDRFDALIRNTTAYRESHPRLFPMDFQKSFTGRLFEEIGFLWYQRMIGTRQTLLDPDKTLEYFLDLYEGLPAHTLLQGGVLNEYVPDGVILPEDGSQGSAVIVEYTAQDRNPRLPKYIHHKEEMVRILRKRFPGIFGGGQLQIIFTNDIHKTVARTRGVDQRTKLTAAPYQHKDIHSFAQELIKAHFEPKQ